MNSGSESELSDTDFSDQYSFSSSPPCSPYSEGPLPCREAPSACSVDEEEDSELLPAATATATATEVVRKKKLQKRKMKEREPGVVYLSRIPPYMKPHKLKYLLSPYGKVGQIYLQPEGMFIVLAHKLASYPGSKISLQKNWSTVIIWSKISNSVIIMVLNSVMVSGFCLKNPSH